MKAVKFATQVNPKILKEFKEYAKESGRSISYLISEALADYLKKARVRPAFRSAMKDVIDENSELLEKLAK